MQVRLATYADRNKWDDYVLSHADGTAYHLFAWRQAVESAYAFNGIYLMAEEGDRLCGILPLVDFRIPFLGRALISLPYCDAGGLLAGDLPAQDALLRQVDSTAKDLRASVKIRSTRQLLTCGVNHTDKVSMILDLPESAEQLFAGLKAKVRSQVKKPLRDGLTVRIGHSELLDKFYRVFAENMHDLGSPVHARNWVSSVVAAYAKHARIVVVYTPDRQPAAAGIILLHPARVSIPWASSLRRFNCMNPNMLLYWSCLEFAADNGYRQFDFGRSTPEEGTYRFKQQWGARPQPLYWYDLESAASVKKVESGRLTQGRSSSRRQLAASLWQRLPQSGTDWLGPKVRKYISL